MRTGISGWHKRIRRSYKQVSRTMQLNDSVTMDPTRDVAGMMDVAARKAILGRSAQESRVAREIPSLENLLTFGISGSNSSNTVQPQLLAPSSTDAPAPQGLNKIEKQNDQILFPCTLTLHMFPLQKSYEFTCYA